MKVAVCLKQIPEPTSPARFDPVTGALVRSARAVMDPSDSYGVEMGLQLVSQAGGGEVVLVSMAPGAETAGLRAALAMGADRAVLVSDQALAGSDALVTAKVLAAAIKMLGPDLVIAATESTDGYTGTMPVALAELLGLPSVTFAKTVTVSAGRLEVLRQTEAGFDQVACPLPALITVTAGAVTPRYPNFRGISGAKNKPLQQLSITDLGLDPESVGWVGAGQEIVGMVAAEARPGGEVIVDDGHAHERIVTYLGQLKVI